jgi:hypothetical protein
MVRRIASNLRQQSNEEKRYMFNPEAFVGQGTMDEESLVGACGCSCGCGGGAGGGGGGGGGGDQQEQ